MTPCPLPSFMNDPQGLALLEAAKASDDPTPRLVLADWLEEQGEAEAAEVVRRSLRELDIWQKLPEAIADRWYPLSGFREGLPGCPCDLPSLAMFPDTPWLTVLEVWFDPPGVKSVRRLLKSSCLTHLHTLDLRENGIGDAGVVALVESSRLAGLHTLILRDNAIGDEGFRALSSTRIFPHLRALDLEYNKPGPEAVEDLRSRRPFARV